MTLKQVHQQIEAAQTLDELDAAENVMDAVANTYPSNESTTLLFKVWEAFFKKKAEILAQSTDELTVEATDVLTIKGVAYPLSEWLTFERYGEQFDVAVNTIVNWISWGIVPSENIKDIAQLDIKLIRAVPYNS